MVRATKQGGRQNRGKTEATVTTTETVKLSAKDEAFLKRKADLMGKMES
jgi:hypothetical protein